MLKPGDMVTKSLRRPRPEEPQSSPAGASLREGQPCHPKVECAPKASYKTEFSGQTSYCPQKT